MAEPTVYVTFTEGGRWEEVPLRLLRHRKFFDSCAAIHLGKIIIDNILHQNGESPIRLAIDDPADRTPASGLSFEDS